MAVTAPLPTTVTDPEETVVDPALSAVPTTATATPSATPIATPSSVTGDFSVKNQLTGLLSQDSDYMKRADTKGAQYSNQRGLLNSSIGATAAHTAAIDAALPIATADADWANKNRMQADTLANERLVKQYEQQNLAFSQYLKGMADVNMQDMPETAKDIAAQRLWEAFQANSRIASTLAGAQINNGEISWGSSSAPSSTATPAETPAGGVASTPGNFSGGTPTNAAPGSAGGPAPVTQAQYMTLQQMKDADLNQYMDFTNNFGNLTPQQVGETVQARNTLLSTKYQGMTVTPSQTTVTYQALDGTYFADPAVRDSYNADLSYTAQQLGVTGIYLRRAFGFDRYADQLGSTNGEQGGMGVYGGQY